MPIDYSKIPTADLEALKSGDYSKVSTPTLEYLKSGSMNQAQPAKVTETPIYQQIMQKMSPYVRPTFEYGGAMLGGLLASPTDVVTGPGGTIAGTGLGYAAGRQAANLFDQAAGVLKPQGLLNEAGAAGRDFVAGTGMEMGGQVAGNLLQRGGQALLESGWPQRLYARSLKTPISPAWKQAMPGADFTKRELAVKTGFEGEVPPTNAGLSTAIRKTNEISDSVHNIVNDLTKQGEALREPAPVMGTANQQSEDAIRLMKHLPGAKFATAQASPLDTSITDLVNQGMASSYGNAAYSTKAGTVSALNELRDRIINMGGTSGKLNPSQLQTLKEQFWKDINWDKSKNIIDPNGRLTEEAIHGVGNAAMRRLEDLAPELKYLNKKEGAYIDLQKAIEHTVARYENLNVGGLQAMILALKNTGLAALEMLTGTPGFKSRLAFTLGKIGTGQLGQEAAKASLLPVMRENTGATRSF